MIIAKQATKPSTTLFSKEKVELIASITVTGPVLHKFCLLILMAEHVEGIEIS